MIFQHRDKLSTGIIEVEGQFIYILLTLMPSRLAQGSLVLAETHKENATLLHIAGTRGSLLILPAYSKELPPNKKPVQWGRT